MKWLQFILSHSIFISLCAAALCYQTFELLHIPANYFIYVLVFFSTLSSYNIYWMISKYHFNNDDLKDLFRNHISNLLFFLLSIPGILICLYYVPDIIPEVLIATGLTTVYSIPLWPVKRLAFTRKAGFLKTLILAFTWTYVTVMIPAGQAGFIHKESLILLFITRFLFMAMLCIIFDSRDIKIDKINSLRSLATDVSRKALQMIMGLFFILYMTTGFILRFYFDNNAQIVAFIITGLLTYIVYRFSLRKQGYFFYYFLVDGLMLFTSLATYVASI